MTLKRDIIAILAGLLISVSLFGSIYTVTLPAPDYALVYTDQEKKVYYAPPYIDSMRERDLTAINVDKKKLKRMTLKEAEDLNYSPDQESREKGYFVQKYRSFSSYMLEKAGLKKPLPIRWTSDGAWNW